MFLRKFKYVLIRMVLLHVRMCNKRIFAKKKNLGAIKSCVYTFLL